MSWREMRERNEMKEEGMRKRKTWKEISKRERGMR